MNDSLASAAHASVEQVRLDKRQALIDSGMNPYPAQVRVTHSLSDIREAFSHLEPDVLTDVIVEVAARVMFKRGSGKIAFGALQQGDGTRLQVMLSAADLGEVAVLEGAELLEDETRDEAIMRLGKAQVKRFEKTVDMGDFVSVRGRVGTSIKGELSVRAHDFRVISKSIRPLPFQHAELSEELSVRQRYAHLIVSQEARDVVRTRSKIVREVRRTLEDEWDFMEVETPVLQNIHGGAQARPFRTHINAYDQEMSLRIALELDLKKSVIAGCESVFSLAKVFRNEGSDSTHLPEFTMLEFYRAFSDMYGMADIMQNLFRRVSRVVNGSNVHVLADGTELDFGPDFAWLSVYDGVSAAVGVTVTSATSAEELRTIAAEHNVDLNPAWSAGKIVMELASELVEPNLIQPTFLHDFPAEAQPLARRNDEDDRRILAWDLIINGMELGCAFTELVDPVIQRDILTAQSLAAANGDLEAMELDEDFLDALALGCPPMGGAGLGIDRLVMLFTGVNARESVLFPILRRE